jgi:hypothetical protein
MSSFGIIGKENTQSSATGNQGIFTPKDVYELTIDKKYGFTNAAYQLLSVTELSGSSTSITGFGGYGQYLIFGSGVTVSEDAALTFRISTDSGATYKSGASDYDYTTRELNDQGTIATTKDTGEDEVHIGSSSEATQPTDFVMECHHFDDADPELFGAGVIEYAKCDVNGTVRDMGFTHWFYNSAGTISGIQFLPTAGTFSGGSIHIYGVTI